MKRFLLLFVGLTFLNTYGSIAVAADTKATPEQIEFFEKKIRPALVEHCYKCHSAESEKLRGGLRLDSKPGWMAGGESGEVIVPGKPDESVLISALNYDQFEMPPKAKLPAAVINDFREWIEMGAADPRKEPASESANVETFDLDERKQWWSLRPTQQVTVPDVGSSGKHKDWPANDYDNFILARLKEKGWEPAPAASKTSWLRRVTYDLTGLPPTPEQVTTFLEDESDQAYEKVVDGLLASTHFGEQWARHWMDLVRYAETKAFEADYPMPNAFEYRDYLIRAFNADVPYNQMVKEAIAGDLVTPRLNPENGNNESVIGPGYMYLTDGQHGPPDVHADEARIFDDMIDVVSKAFVGQTVACARCHDHKFDAITTEDYYSLYGIIASSRIDYADIHSPKERAKSRKELRTQKTKIQTALADLAIKDLANLKDDLIAVRGGKPDSNSQRRWADAMEKKANKVTATLAHLVQSKNESELKKAWKNAQDDGTPNPSNKDLGRLTRDSFGEWLPSGDSFENAPRKAGDFIVAHEGDNAIVSFANARPASGHLASKFAGSLKSPRFTLEGDQVNVRVKGKNVRVSLYVRHYELIGRGPTTNGTTKVINSDGWVEHRFNTRLWVGEPAYIEIQQNGGQMEFRWDIKEHVDGSYAVLDAATNNKPLPPVASQDSAAAEWNLGEAPSTPDGAIKHLAKTVSDAAQEWRDGTLSVDQGDLLEALFEAGVFDFNLTRSSELKQAVEDFRAMQREVAPPSYVRTLADGHGIDEPVYIRGSHKNRSEAPNERHFLDGMDGTPFTTPGSGRLQFAETLVKDDNPLAARIMTNRIWHHLFGRGIVPSVDDFGHMGDQPAYPELLDFLANQFVADGWSMKSLIRELVLSSTYRMSTTASPESLREDPNNIFVQHMPIRRLQAEAIRDTVLAVSGRLDPKLFGPSVAGDGGNRRSVYIQLKRRFMPDFLMTFDMPNATETFGRRNITAGPTQSLAMMNSPFVWKAAESWADQVANKKLDSFESQIQFVHQKAFGRDATEKEIRWAEQFAADHNVKSTDQPIKNKQMWIDICHTMLNRKELIYVY